MGRKRLPQITTKNFERYLVKKGFVLKSCKGDHKIYKNDYTKGYVVVVQSWREIYNHQLREYLNDALINQDEFMRDMKVIR